MLSQERPQRRWRNGSKPCKTDNGIVLFKQHYAPHQAATMAQLRLLHNFLYPKTVSELTVECETQEEVEELLEHI